MRAVLRNTISSKEVNHQNRSHDSEVETVTQKARRGTRLNLGSPPF